MFYLTWSTVVMTYFLMVWGNLVSATGSGLACPDWPLCNGTLTPQLDSAVLLEWGHRILAFSTGSLIVVTLWKVFRNGKRTDLGIQSPAMLRFGKTLLFLLGIQILLGGLTVLLGLSMWVSSVHLLIASLIWSGLIAIACTANSSPQALDLQPHRSDARSSHLCLIGMGMIITQLLLGALVRHGHAGLACASFPNCNESFFPTSGTFEEWVAFLHRWWGIASICFFAFLAYHTAKESPPLSRTSRRVFALALAQIFLGIGVIKSGLSVHSRAIHAAVGYLIWGKLTYLWIQSVIHSPESPGRFSHWLWKNKKWKSDLHQKPVLT